MPSRLIRLDEVRARTGLGRSSIYSAMKNGSFPKSVPIGSQAIAWVEEEIEQWIRSKIANRRGRLAESIRETIKTQRQRGA